VPIQLSFLRRENGPLKTKVIIGIGTLLTFLVKIGVEMDLIKISDFKVQNTYISDT
jgi:hypothetical protein